MTMRTTPPAAALLLVLLGQAAYARELHVSVNGNDSNDGSPSRPYRTISAAAALAQPGDAVTVHEGTYRERTHRAMTQGEVERKLGARIAKSYAWVNHDVFDNVKEAGTTTRGNKVLLNQTFLAADLKICISGIKVHQDAGYGGGAKAVLPGLAALPTVEYNHTQILTKVRTTGPVKVFKNDMRLDMIEAARMAKVDYTVQIMYNDHLLPTGIWAGDIVDAHHAGVRVAAKTYCTPTFKDADVVVANAYPQNAQAFHGALWINYSIRDGGTGVLVVQHPLGLDPIHYLNNRLAGRSGATQFDLTSRRVSGGGRGNPKQTNLIVYSQYLTRNLKNKYKTGTFFCDQC